MKEFQAQFNAPALFLLSESKTPSDAKTMSPIHLDINMMKNTIKEIKDILKNIDKKNDESDYRNDQRVVGAEEEWTFAAFVVDRCCLYVFFIYLIVVILALGYPLLRETNWEPK